MLARILRLSVNLLPWKLRLVIKGIPVVAPFQRWLVARFMAHGTFMHMVNDGPAKGLRYPVCLPQDKAIWAGIYEPAFARALAESVRPGDVCCDIGSYRGFFSGVLALAGARRVYAFDPLAENCLQIRSVIAANPELPIELFEIAVGDRAGHVDFQVMPEASMGKLASSPFQAEEHGIALMRVEMRSLDELVQSGRVEIPNIIKIDVEGAEMFVLEGAGRLLAAAHPKLFIEVHSRQLARRCRDLLKANGYSIRVLETETEPDFCTEPEVCHFVCAASSGAIVHESVGAH